MYASCLSLLPTNVIHFFTAKTNKKIIVIRFNLVELYNLKKKIHFIYNNHHNYIHRLGFCFNLNKLFKLSNTLYTNRSNIKPIINVHTIIILI